MHRVFYDHKVRWIRDLPCGETRVYLEVPIRRVWCQSCGKVKQEQLAWLADHPFDTKRFAFFVGRRCRASPLRDVAKELSLDWKTVKELDKHYMRGQLRRVGTPGPRIIGIDEGSIKKGHTYRVVVSDLGRRRPIWFGGKDRSEASLDAFYQWLGPKKSQHIRLAVMDMWPAFRTSTLKPTQAPQAAILLKAIQRIVIDKKRNDISFLIMGSGPEWEDLKTLAKDMNLESTVTFTGRISDNELFTALSTSDVCVNPDVANEMNDKSTMNKIMEYMAFKKPIVQFDLTEGKVSAGAASLYAKHNDADDFADKIIELIDDPAKCKKMGEFGHNRVVNELAWKFSEKKLLDAYALLNCQNVKKFEARNSKHETDIIAGRSKECP